MGTSSSGGGGGVREGQFTVTILFSLCIFTPYSVVIGGGSSSGSTSSISIYQSTSGVPPLAESFSEGSCVIPQTARKLDTKWVVRQSTFYVPLASKFTFRLIAETFLSRAGVSEQDVKSMCLTVDFFPDGPGVNLTSTGFDLREVRSTCPVIWRGQFTCLPVGGSPGTNSARARSTDNYVVAVDNQSFMLVVRCVDGFFKDYMLLTTRPVVSPELYHTVLSTIKDLGFDSEKVQLLTYDSCLRTDRFVTAVSVHHHHHHHHNNNNGHHHGDTSASISFSAKGGGGGGGIGGGGGGLRDSASISITKGGNNGVVSGALRPSFGGGFGGKQQQQQQQNHRFSFSAQGGGGGGGGAIPITATIIGSSGGGGGGSLGHLLGGGGGLAGLSERGGGGGGGGRFGNGGLASLGGTTRGLGGGGGAGKGTKVEEVEAYYAIIP